MGRSILAKGQEKIQPVRVESLRDGMSGVPLEGSNHVVYLSQANSAGIDVVQNEAVNQEAGNCGLSLSLFQQQMMLNQQMLTHLGPKVNDTLARVVNSGIRAKIDRNVAKELCEKFVRPRNCEALVVPKINKELWNTSAFKKTTKEGDKCFQTAQRYMSQGLIPLVSLMDKLLETDQAEEFRLAKESFQLLAYAHRDISNIRRQQLKGVVSDKYKQLCNDSTPLTGNLLGDDLEKQIKTLDEMRKVGFDLSTTRAEVDGTPSQIPAF